MKTFCLTIATLSLAIPALPTAAETSSPAPVTVNGLDFKPGSDWTAKKPSSSMRAAELEIKPSADAPPLTAVFYYFGAGQGGDSDANIQRWLGQFDGGPATKDSKDHECDGKTVTILHATGTYMESQGGPFGPKTPRPDFALLGAVVPGADANIFIKLTGPGDQIAALKEKFTALATSPFTK